jgi:hypothetical protein
MTSAEIMNSHLTVRLTDKHLKKNMEYLFFQKKFSQLWDLGDHLKVKERERMRNNMTIMEQVTQEEVLHPHRNLQ